MPAISLLFLAFSFGFVLAGCGSSAKMKVLRTTLVTVDAAREGMETFDRAYQVKTIDEAKSREDALAKIQDYRAKRAVIIEAFTIAYKTLAAAAMDPTEVNYLEALKRAQDLYKEVKKFKETLGGKPVPPAVDMSPSSKLFVPRGRYTFVGGDA
jgi:hypothetical protein